MITTSLSKAGPFECDGTQTEFTFAFPVLDKSHIAVYLDDVKITTGYTTALATPSNGGTVTFTTAPAAGSRLAIVRDVPLEQGVDLQNNTAFLPEVIEGALDRLTMICQQLKETFTRTLTVPPTSNLSQEEISRHFNELAEHADDWVLQTKGKAAEASASAGAAADSAVDAGTSAVAASTSAAAAADSAEAARTYMAEIELNRVTLTFSDWGLDGTLLAYGSWTPEANTGREAAN